jgi:dihydroorotase
MNFLSPEGSRLEFVLKVCRTTNVRHEEQQEQDPPSHHTSLYRTLTIMIPERVEGYAAEGSRLKIPLPDDFHHHCRDGAQAAAVVRHAAARFGRCLVMPNLVPPVTTAEMALAYKERILKSLSDSSTKEREFDVVMVLYLTDRTKADEIVRAHENGIVGCKYYPAGATTNSDHGVTDVKNCYDALREMERRGMVLCIHSEVTHSDIFDREPIFIDEIMRPLVVAFPHLKITMEHISTKDAVDYVMSAPDNVKASITAHHLLYNRNRTCL